LSTESEVLISNGSLESNAAQTGSAGMGVNMYPTFFANGNFATQVAARFSSIRVKGYSINRFVMGTSLNLAQTELLTSPLT